MKGIEVFPQTNDSFFYSCISVSKWGYEQFIPDHVLTFQKSGETHIFHQQGTFIFKPNRILLARKNQFARSLKIPSNGNYEVISVILKSEHLKKYAVDNNLIPEKSYKGKNNLLLKSDSYLRSYFESLLPYLKDPEKSNEKLVFSKVTEAIELLLNISPGLSKLLFDFNDPHKIDLEEFMLKNFQYNAPIKNFARLTGRSLAGFKRDFRNLFNTTPSRWLKNKRLEEAHYLIHKKRRKPADFYLEIGFESLPHFYTAFKEKYGVTPNESLGSNN